MVLYPSLVPLATLLLQIHQSLTAEMTRRNKMEKNIGVEATVDRGQMGMFRSPGFPTCCERTSLANYTLRYEGTRSIYGLSMLFEDLDLPPDSTIQIHDMNSTVYATPLPRYTRHGWTRPYVILPAKNLMMIVHFGSPGHSKYVGFKASYWPESKKPMDDVPYTECPPVRDAMDGGQVSLETKFLRFKEEHYRYDCVWQLKPPSTDQGMMVYLRIESLDLTDGEATIRKGLDSEGAILKEYIEESFTASANGLNDHNTFHSLSGFYIRVMKPIDTGHFRFSYGVYVDYGVSQDGNTECSYGLTDQEMEGYHCQHGSSWCIPKGHRCDGRRNCPAGDDEEDCEVATLMPEMVLLAAAVVPCDKECQDGTCMYPWNKCPEEGGPCADKQKQCEDNSCVMQRETCVRCLRGQKQCQDGTCIAPTEDCAGTCDVGQKKCMDGRCVAKHTEKCPEEASCPDYKPLQCLSSRECYYTYEKCDGSNNCIDGSDEQDCAYACKSQGKLACKSGNGCYFDGDKCDGYSTCSDGSDEEMCGSFSWYELKQWAFVPVLPIIFASCVLYLMKKESYTKEMAIKRQERELLLSGDYSSGVAWTISPIVPMFVGILIMYMAASDHKDKQKKRRARQRAAQAAATGGVDNQGVGQAATPRPQPGTRNETAADRAAAAREHLAQTSAYHSIVARAAASPSSRPPSRSPRHSRSPSGRSSRATPADSIAADLPRPAETPPPPYDDAIKIVVDAPPEEAPPSYLDVHQKSPHV